MKQPSKDELLAPCVAVVGPARSGKTTLVNLLDEALGCHPRRPEVYVVKGNPDGTGRYLHHSPEMRESIKSRVKGSWTPSTFETIAAWIRNCRRHLEVVLVDLGGRRAEENDTIFQQCSHYLILSRGFDSPEEESSCGMSAWIEDCERNGLIPIAHLSSIWRSDEAHVAPGPGGSLVGTFRADASSPGDRINREVVNHLVDRLLEIRRPPSQPIYFDLRLDRAWTVEDLVDLAGLERRLKSIVERERAVSLGGRAPIWAYSRAMHLAMDTLAGVNVSIFDPKVSSGFIDILPDAQASSGSALDGAIDVHWLGDGCLDLVIKTEDRFLLELRRTALNVIPKPEGEPPPSALVVSGGVPTWLHLVYSRWLRECFPSRDLGHFDLRLRSAVFVTGPSAPFHEPRPIPRIPE